MSINLPYVEGTSNCEKNEIMKHCWEANYNFSWDQKKKKKRESQLQLSRQEISSLLLSRPE